MKISKRLKFIGDLIKDKRFTMDKFLFHVPITLNFKNQKLEYINELIIPFLVNNSHINNKKNTIKILVSFIKKLFLFIVFKYKV